MRHRAQRVLVIGASGGVGTFAVQLAALRGAEVWATCRARNALLLERLGAVRTLDHRVVTALLAWLTGWLMWAVIVIILWIASQFGGPAEPEFAPGSDGAALLMGMMWSMRASNLWSDARGENLLDTGAPFYDVYETADGQRGEVTVQPTQTLTVNSVLASLPNASLRDIRPPVAIPQPPGSAVRTIGEALPTADAVGYPVLVRPHYVISGRGMHVDRKHLRLTRALQRPVRILQTVAGEGAHDDLAAVELTGLRRLEHARDLRDGAREILVAHRPRGVEREHDGGALLGRARLRIRLLRARLHAPAPFRPDRRLFLCPCRAHGRSAWIIAVRARSSSRL